MFVGCILIFDFLNDSQLFKAGGQLITKRRCRFLSSLFLTDSVDFMASHLGWTRATHVLRSAVYGKDDKLSILSPS